MRIWLIKFDETLPVDPNPRLFRMGMLADALIAAGHEVVWWASTYDHAAGRLRFSSDTFCEAGPRYQVRLLHTVSGYARAVSVARVLNNFRQAARLRSAAAAAPRPDLIFCAMPTPELAWVATGLGRRYGVPVVIDARDMWPDIFVELLPPTVRMVAWPYTAVMRMLLRSAARRAAGCTAITEPFLDWILGYAGRPRRPADGAFPLGYQDVATPMQNLALAEATLAEHLPNSQVNAFTVVFLGRLNRTVLDAFEPVLDAVRRLRGERRSFQFVFAGTGDCAAALRARAASFPEIVFLGHVGSAVMAALKRRAHVALLCITRRRDYQISLSNKVFDYLAAGLPLASHLTGLVGELLAVERCGFVYDDGEGLAGGLKRLAANESERVEMGRRARNAFVTRFEAGKVYAGLAAHLAFVAHDARRSPSDRVGK